MLACHENDPGTIPGRGRFSGDLFLALAHWRLCISRGSHDHVKWRCRLTGLEWDVKEPLRTTSSLAVTTLSVPINNLGRLGDDCEWLMDYEYDYGAPAPASWHASSCLDLSCHWTPVCRDERVRPILCKSPSLKSKSCASQGTNWNPGRSR